MLSRRTTFVALSLLVALAMLASCAPPTPEKIVETVVVTKEVPVEVTKEVPVEVTVEVPVGVPVGELRPEDIPIRVMGYGSPADVTRVTNLVEAARRINMEWKKEEKPERIVCTVSEFETAGDIDGYRMRFILASKAGTAPDIRAFTFTEVPEWAEAGYIIPLDKYIEEYPDVFGDTIPAMWDACTWKGVRYAVPQDTEVRIVFFRKDKLRELGWTDAEIEALPDKVLAGEFTLDDMIALGKEAVDAGVTKWGIFHRPSKGFTFFMPYFAEGGLLQNPETGKLVLDESAALYNLEFHYDICQVSRITPPEITTFSWREGIHPVVVAGDTLFWWGGTWHWAEYQRVDYGVGTFTEEEMWETFGFMLYPPKDKGGRPLSISNPYVYMISSSSKNPDLAFKVVAKASEPDLVVKHALESGHLAWRKAALEVPAYKENAFVMATTPLLEYTRFCPAHPLWEKYLSITYSAIQGVEMGDMTPEEALEFLKTELKAAIGDELEIVP